MAAIFTVIRTYISKHAFLNAEMLENTMNEIAINFARQAYFALFLCYKTPDSLMTGAVVFLTGCCLT